MLWGHSLIIYEPFWGKKANFTVYFSRKRRSLLRSNTAQRSFFFPIIIDLFLGKRKEKLARKARINTDASISDRGHAPWASHNIP